VKHKGGYNNGQSNDNQIYKNHCFSSVLLNITSRNERALIWNTEGGKYGGACVGQTDRKRSSDEDSIRRQFLFTAAYKHVVYSNKGCPTFGMKRSIEYEATHAVFFIHLFISGLFNNGVNISNYTTSKGKITK
jgi:isoprenylcysteine carboxyl methyltransferase (ICMT) family protein YpbQ